MVSVVCLNHFKIFSYVFTALSLGKMVNIDIKGKENS